MVVLDGNFAVGLLAWNGLPLNTYISMYAKTNRCYNERGSRTIYVRSSIPHCIGVIDMIFYENSLDSCLLGNLTQDLMKNRTDDFFSFFFLSSRTPCEFWLPQLFLSMISFPVPYVSNYLFPSSSNRLPRTLRH